MAVAAYVTTQARLKPYEYLSELGESVLCCDTDSFIFIQYVGEPQNVRKVDYLGHLTDEMEEFRSGPFIQEFVLGLQEILLSVALLGRLKLTLRRLEWKCGWKYWNSGTYKYSGMGNRLE